MADKISFGLYDSANAPIVGATIGPAGIHFSQYTDRTGSARSQPTIVEIGGGLYGFIPSDADESTGVCFLIDCTLVSGADPHRFSGAVCRPSQPLICWHLEDEAGDVWTGALPTVGVWKDFAGADRTPPVVTRVGSLFVVVPSDDDLQTDVAFRFDSPALATPADFTGDVEGVGSSGDSDTTIGALIRSLLMASTPVTTLVSSRVYPNKLPQQCDLPAVVYTIVSGVPESSFDGGVDDTLSAYRLQVDCYARALGTVGAYAQAHDLAKKVTRVIGDISTPSLTAFKENERDIYDDTTEYHRVSIDFTIWR